MFQGLKNNWPGKWYFHLRQGGGGLIWRKQVCTAEQGMVFRVLSLEFPYLQCNFRVTLKWKLANKSDTINKRKWSDLIGLSNGCKRAWLWLVKRTYRWKKWSNNGFSILRVFFGGKTKSPCFDPLIHWLIKQIKNTYRNHFFMLYENRSISDLNRISFCNGRL